jgi:hypothetical protein
MHPTIEITASYGVIHPKAQTTVKSTVTVMTAAIQSLSRPAGESSSTTDFIDGVAS